MANVSIWNMGRLLTVCFLSFGISVHTAGAQEYWSMQRCIDYAIGNNVDLQKQLVAVEQQKVQVGIAENKIIPRVDLALNEYFYPNYSLTDGLETAGGARHTSMLNFSPSINATMPLYQGGLIRSGKETEKFNLLAETSRYDWARNNLRIQVAAYYLQVLYCQGLADVSRKQVEVSQKLLMQATSLVKEGRKPESELAEAKAQLAADEFKLSQSEGNVLLSIVDLAKLLNIEDIDDFLIEDTSFQTDIVPDLASIQTSQQIFDSVVERYPSIIAAKASLDASIWKVKSAKSKLYPQISLMASLPTNHYYYFDTDVKNLYQSFGGQVRDLFNPVIGIKITYTICNGKETRHDIRKANLNVKTSQLNLTDSRLNLRKELQDAYYNAVTSISNYNSAVKAEDASKISFDYVQKSYEAGRSTFFDLTQANQKWVNAMNDVVQGRYEYLIRKQILEFYTDL